MDTQNSIFEADWIVVGGGPGGYETALKAARKGNSVVLIERDKLGGTCLNCGCIPTKALCRAAEVVETVKKAAEMGVEVEGWKADYAAAHSRMQGVVEQLRTGVESSMKACNVTVVKGEGILKPEGCVKVDDQLFKAAKGIIIATGSRPSSLPIPGAELAMNSDRLLELDTLPQSLVIIGGGVIGMEFASILNTYGVAVTVVEYCPEIIPNIDSDIAKRLRTALSRRGIKFQLSAAVTAIEAVDGGFKVTYNGKKGEASVEAEKVLMATGRQPVLPQGVEELGIATTRRGITVDDDMLTSVPGIYAIGDVNGRCMLAHAAEAQGAVVLGEKRNLDVIPSAVFTSPEVGASGMTLAQAMQCEEYEHPAETSIMYGRSGKALAMGETFGLAKIVYDSDSGRLLGFYAVGAHAADMAQEASNAIALGLTRADVAFSVHIHPTLSELLKMLCEDD